MATTGGCAWLGGSSTRVRQQDSPASVALQGGGQAVHPEFALAVDRCSEVHHWDFDPMLVEVDACLAKPQAGLTSQAVEVAQAVDLCPNECGSGQTSPWPSLVEPEQAGGSLPAVQIDFSAIQEGAGGGGPATPAVDGGAPNATATTSIEDFIAAFKKPLTPPVLSSPPRLRRTWAERARAGELDDSELVPKRSRQEQA
jgi:hypothetical protein